MPANIGIPAWIIVFIITGIIGGWGYKGNYNNASLKCFFKVVIYSLMIGIGFVGGAVLLVLYYILPLGIAVIP